MLKKSVVFVLLLVASTLVRAEAKNPCAGTPPDAVTQLPAPLSEWGTIVCTPHGHIIFNHEGWIWSKPGGYSPVFVPSQMVQTNPAPVGNKSYFTRIAFKEVDLRDPAASKALATMQEGYSPETPIKAFRLDVRGSLGRTLVLYFFDWGDSVNGIWCGQDGTQCKASSTFMLLNMRRGMPPRGGP